MTGQPGSRLWFELGTTMRRVRGEAGVSLRELESRGTWRRSTISQVENGKARPSRQLVEWYDTELGTDGLLLSIYAEARSRQLSPLACGRVGPTEDSVTVVDVDPPAGLLVNASARLQVRVTLANSGAETWHGRRLRRMGAYAGTRLIGSAPEAPVPDTPPGGLAEIVLPVRAPERRGTVVAYWHLVTAEGLDRAPLSPPVAVVLVVG